MSIEQKISPSTVTLNIGDGIRLHFSATLYRLWAVVGAISFATLEIEPPLASKFWLLIPLLGVTLSIALTAIWLRQASDAEQAGMKPWVLHWSCVMIASTLVLLELTHQPGDPQWVAEQLLLSLSLGLMTAGLYLNKSLLKAGLALAFCYLYAVSVQTGAGLLCAFVCAAMLWNTARS